MSSKYSKILNTLALKIESEEQDTNAVDKQFNKIYSKIESLFMKNDFEGVLEWFHEIVKKEVQIKKKIIDYPEVYDKPLNNILISKMQTLHSKIIELVVDKIDNNSLNYIPQSFLQELNSISI